MILVKKINSKEVRIMMITKPGGRNKKDGVILGEIKRIWVFMQIPKNFPTHSEDTASMALPSGHAASTACSPYFTFFTNVIVCDGFNPNPSTRRVYW